MKYSVIYTEHGIETSEAIHAQLYNRWGEKTTLEFEERVFHILKLLEDSPFMFPVASFDLKLRKAIIHKNCSIFFEVNLNKVYIHFFWDNRQEPLF